MGKASAGAPHRSAAGPGSVDDPGSIPGFLQRGNVEEAKMPDPDAAAFEAEALAEGFDEAPGVGHGICGPEGAIYQAARRNTAGGG